MFGAESTADALWLGVGFLGQAAFTSRFLVQWLASERRRDSVVPTAFWWLSLAGGVTLLSYALYKRDPVIIVGQFAGVFIYTRNLYLIAVSRPRRREEPAAAPEAMLPPGVRAHSGDDAGPDVHHAANGRLVEPLAPAAERA